MFKTEFNILHKGCWGSEINVKFPEIKFSSVDCRWIKGKVVHILLCKGSLADSAQSNSIIKYLSGRDDVEKVEMLSKDDSTLYLRVSTRRTKKIAQFSDIFFKNNCFPVVPTRFEDNLEIWTLGTADKKNFTNVYNKLKARYRISIKYLKEEALKQNLTQKQLEILNYAKHFGYFEWPRKKSATEICALLKIPKTVFLSHLRKAENKILNEYLSTR